MANLTFTDSHNMVAYLEKSAENADFAETVDFLNANPIRKTKRKATEVSQSSRPTTLVEDETVHEERGDRVERATTTASSLEVEQDSGTIIGPNPHQYLMSLFLRKLVQKRIKRLENKRKSRTPQLKKRLFKVRIESSTEKSLGNQEDASKQGRNDQDEGISFVQEDAETQGSAPVTTVGVSVSTAEPKKSKEKGVSSTRLTRGVIMKEASDTASRPIVPPQQHLDPKDKGKDYELAQRLQAKEQGELTIKERSKLFVELKNKRKKHFVKLRAEEIRRKPPTKAQKRNQLCTYLKNMANYKYSQLKNKSFEEIQMLFDNTIKWINLFVPMDSEVLKSSRKKAESSGKEAVKPKDKEADELSQEELQQMMIIVPVDDLVMLWSLVKEKFKATETIDDKEREIWVELKRLFELDTNDELWKLQKHIHDLTWKLYDSCGVHHVSTEKGIDIYMLVEKEYPLSRGTLTLMLVAKLLVN
uniref:Uncharacterized protein n=1 Tax=Tanacetum cinerariifolium TaxID=118510 RepID=A0A699IGL3_TANCI|nr:hypothetical protein [Tanacetum cinerariifolium]